MTTCARCGAGLARVESEIPKCVRCVGLERPHPDESFSVFARDRVHSCLKDAVVAAKDRVELASKVFDATLNDVPGELHPAGSVPRHDDSVGIHNASRLYAHARGDLMIAIRRLHAFTLEGTIPDDLEY